MKHSIKTVSIFLLTCLTAIGLTSSNRKVTIFIIGDSTAAEKSSPATNPERGWGMVLQGCFTEDILVDNHAVNGRSSKSFWDEGRWKKVVDRIAPGDYVLIQFGHNDEKPAPDRHTEPGSTFDDNLRRYVRETREKGGFPVLLNAVVRRKFYLENDHNDDDEKLRNKSYEGDELINSDTLIDTHGEYRLVPERIAKEMKVVFIDANRITHDIEQRYGVVGSRKLHVWYKPGEISSLPKGRQDNTHYNVYGARIVADALATELAAKVPALRKYVRHYDYVVSKEGRGNYMDLQTAIDDVPSNRKTSILILDGTWNKPYIAKGKKVKLIRYSGVRFK